MLVGARVFHVDKEEDGRTEDITKLLHDSGNFAKASNNYSSYCKTQTAA
jgi:hypothetical protein